MSSDTVAYSPRYPPSELATSFLGNSKHDEDWRSTVGMPVMQPSFAQKYLLRSVSLTLHICLVLIHIVLLISTIKHWEHRVVFPIEDQQFVRFFVTSTAAMLATISTAILVFVTQKLAMQRNLRSYQTLTATHDNISAWAGLGAAASTLYAQLAVPSSVLEVLKITGYLGCAAILHLTISNTISVETFTSAFPVAGSVSTFGIPEFRNSTTVNSTHDFMTIFPPDFIQWREVLDASQMPGLQGGSLHEVLQFTTREAGAAPVSAVGFNIDCGYIPGVLAEVIPEQGLFQVQFNSSQTLELDNGNFVSNLLMVANSRLEPPTTSNSIILYTTNTVIDSGSRQGSPIILKEQAPAVVKNLTTPTFTPGITQMQILQCFNTIVPQAGTIDTQLNTLRGSLNQTIYKTSSKWLASDEIDRTPPDSTLIGSGLWATVIGTDMNTGRVFTDLDKYLMNYLNLDPYADGVAEKILELHDIENALSSLVAMLFWIAPMLVGGTTAILQDFPRLRLDSSLAIASLGMIASIIQLVLCIGFIHSLHQAGDPVVDGAGLLQMLWLWRSHPELSGFLRAVKQPSSLELRTAGRTPVQLSKTVSSEKQKNQHREEEGSHDGDSADAPIPNQAVRPPKGHSLQSLCIPLHVVLVVIYFILLCLAIAHIEHHIVFPTNSQQTVAHWCKVISHALGTVYYAFLLYLAQNAAISHVVQEYTPFTATHDKVLAWSGIGSALSTLYKQLSLPTSFLGIFSISIYLSSVSILSIITPTLLSVETFNATVRTTVHTQSILEWGESSHNCTLDFIQSTGAFLPWIDSLGESDKLGIYNGTLYDVLIAAYPAIGKDASLVSSVSFNITCGYISEVTVDVDSTDPYSPYRILFSQYGVTFQPAAEFLNGLENTVLIGPQISADSITLYTSNPVFDSAGNRSPVVALPNSTAILNTNMSLQFMACSRSLIHQIVQVNITSRAVLPDSLDPSVFKMRSSWGPYSTSSQISNETSLLESDSWAEIVSLLGVSVLPTDFDVGSLYISETLGLDPLAELAQGAILYLHNIENAVANLAASMFWTAGRIHPTSLDLADLRLGEAFGTAQFSGQLQPPELSTGISTVEHGATVARIDISLVAASIGLAAAIALLCLVFVFPSGKRQSRTHLDNLGFLQIIWVFQHHPEFSEILEQVEVPTDDHLRFAGLSQVRLADALPPEGVF
ncbi:hypothetical protein B0H16DRAFT_1882409 [Mycena metata]|uniref:Uncharacterized protein n=1 Tax=Mycena metata TaxID=1033252 RepID=A0AAD7JLW4_9AGAR|nr:hypothetical protein B0H16DRAFT_1882409 [Mycena metata]